MLIKQQNVRLLKLTQVPSADSCVHFALEDHCSALAPYLQKEVSVGFIPTRIVLIFDIFVDNLEENGAELLFTVGYKRVSDVIKSIFLIKWNAVRNKVLILFWRVFLQLLNVPCFMNFLYVF